MKNKIAVVTGASSGLGESLSYELAKKNYALILGARNVAKLEEIKLQCEKLGASSVVVHALDLADKNSVENFADGLPKSVDVLFNNAGIGLYDEFIAQDFSIIEQMFAVNVLGLLELTQLVARNMAANQTGHIFMVASLAGVLPTEKSSVYAATKASIIAFSKAFRLEMKRCGVLVTTVNLGPMRTAFHKDNAEYLDHVGKFVLEPEKVAHKMVEAIGKNKREMNEPKLLSLGGKILQPFPRLTDFVVYNFMNMK
jgi:short-subunit dehydrogenase